MFINGVSVDKLTGFSLPFTTGYWSIRDGNYRSAFIEQDNPTQAPNDTNDLSHWDMFQFDGPAPSYNPVAKTYIQPGCPGTVSLNYHIVNGYAQFLTGSATSATVNLNIPDDVFHNSISETVVQRTVTKCDDRDDERKSSRHFSGQ